MKKLLILCLSALVLVGCSSNSSATSEETTAPQTSETASEETIYADTFTSASLTRTVLSGNALDEAYTALVSLSNDLATLADSQVEGYSAPESKLAQVMSVNPDGSIAMSTIHAWKVDPEAQTVTIVMTEGQTISNLAEVGKRGSILVHGDVYYNMHVEVADVVKLDYSDEAYNNGEFNVDYSGKDNQFAEYTVTLNILTIESTPLYVFD